MIAKHLQQRPAVCACAALPFICLNVLAGGLTMYGLANLRYEGWAIGEFCGLLLLQSLVAIQVVMFAVYLTPNQARAAGASTWQSGRLRVLITSAALWVLPRCGCAARSQALVGFIELFNLFLGYLSDATA